MKCTNFSYTFEKFTYSFSRFNKFTYCFGSNSIKTQKIYHPPIFLMTFSSQFPTPPPMLLVLFNQISSASSLTSCKGNYIVCTLHMHSRVVLPSLRVLLTFMLLLLPHSTSLDGCTLCFRLLIDMGAVSHFGVVKKPCYLPSCKVVLDSKQE